MREMRVGYWKKRLSEDISNEADNNSEMHKMRRLNVNSEGTENQDLPLLRHTC